MMRSALGTTRTSLAGSSVLMLFLTFIIVGVAALSSSTADAKLLSTDRGVHVRFVLLPAWLPRGWDANSGSYRVPRGLHVYPHAQMAETESGTTASGRPLHRSIPVLFTYGAYSRHGNLLLDAEPSQSGKLLLDGPNIWIGHRHVFLDERSPVFQALWIERGDLMSLSVVGMSDTQFRRVVARLTEVYWPPPPTHP
jgi:hypothetical protein